jgi:hypothetical protein
MSSTRARFLRVSASRPSVSLRRSLYFETPAASSRKTRSSSGLARDHSLLDDRVGARSQPRAEEQVVDVAAAHRDVVDVVRRILVARQHALDRELDVFAPLAPDPARAVVEGQLDRGPANGLALARAIEDHVLHRLAAKRRRLRFAEDPANGVDHVGLAAAVGADDTDQLARRADGRGVDKGLEPGELDLGEAQGDLRVISASRRATARCKRERTVLRGSSGAAKKRGL